MQPTPPAGRLQLADGRRTCRATANGRWTGEARQLERGNLESSTRGTWFRDGRRVLVQAAEPGHGMRCYVQDVGGGPPRPVTPEGTSDSLLSPDEQRILALGPDGHYDLYPLEGGEPQPVPGLRPSDGPFHWSPDGRSVLTLPARGEPPYRVERVDLATGVRTTFVEIVPPVTTGGEMIGAVVFTDDEQSYAYMVVRSASDLFVSEGVR